MECSLRNGALSSLGNELLRKQNFCGHGTRSRAEVTWVTALTVALLNVCLICDDRCRWHGVQRISTHPPTLSNYGNNGRGTELAEGDSPLRRNVPV